MTFLCPECFDNKALQKRLIEIRPQAPDEKCTYHPHLKGIPLEDVADIIDPVLQNNFEHGRYDPRTDDFWGDALESIIEQATGADNPDVAAELARHLIENDPYNFSPFYESPFYVEGGSYERNLTGFQGHNLRWKEFCDGIISSQRFFNDRARELLDVIFKGIHLQQGTNSERPVYLVHPGDPTARIFRARLASTSQEAQAIKTKLPGSLAPPPLLFRRAGRMNPSGVSAFYGAFDFPTCIAELRPPVGSFIVGAQFEVTRPICLLDMTKFSAPFKEPDMFAKHHIERTTQWRFMQRFMHEISRPVSKDDEHLSYIPTQAVAEYLLCKHEFHLNGHRHRIEGIIFRSAQHPDGRNIVLLGDAAKVLSRSGSTLTIPDGDPLRHIVTSSPTNPEKVGLQLSDDSVEIHWVTGATFTSVPDTSPEYRPNWEANEFEAFEDD